MLYFIHDFVHFVARYEQPCYTSFPVKEFLTILLKKFKTILYNDVKE